VDSVQKSLWQTTIGFTPTPGFTLSSEQSKFIETLIEGSSSLKYLIEALLLYSTFTLCTIYTIVYLRVFFPVSEPLSKTLWLEKILCSHSLIKKQFFFY